MSGPRGVREVHAFRIVLGGIKLSSCAASARLSYNFPLSFISGTFRLSRRVQRLAAVCAMSARTRVPIVYQRQCRKRERKASVACAAGRFFLLFPLQRQSVIRDDTQEISFPLGGSRGCGARRPPRRDDDDDGRAVKDERDDPHQSYSC